MMTKTQKIAIFGGSFDPPHFGHIDIVKNLEKKFDRVIVMPSYISPFKAEGNNASARLALCKKVFASQKTEVSRYEIGKKGVSYSVDTAQYLSRKIDGKLFWVIGSEELTRLNEWHDIDRLKKLVTFYVVARPEYDITEKALASLKKNKIKIKLAPFCGLDISSTRLKIDMAFGKPNIYAPYAVYEYAVKHDLFNPYGKYVEGLKKHGLSYSRLVHTYGTAVRGEQLAKLYGASSNDAVTACILHDIAKSENPSDYEGKVDLSGFPAPTLHAPIGGYIAKKEFGVSDEIADAIVYHSTAKAGLSTLGEIVYLADKTEQGRKYPSLEHKRYVCTLGKELAMLACLTEISELENNEKCEYTRKAIEYYKTVCGGTEIPELPANPTSGNLPIAVAHKSTAVRAVAPKTKALKTAEPKRKELTAAPFGERVAASRPAFKPTGDVIRDTARLAARELSLHKAHNIAIVNLEGKTIVADYFVIASATSTTQVKALMGYVEDVLTKELGLNPNKRDVNSEWIALDYGGVIIHIFTDKMREFYNIERLWSDGKNVERYED